MICFQRNIYTGLPLVNVSLYYSIFFKQQFFTYTLTTFEKEMYYKNYFPKIMGRKGYKIVVCRSPECTVMLHKPFSSLHANLYAKE